MVRRGKNLTDDAIEQIVRLLDGWEGKLTWEALIDAIVTRLHVGTQDRPCISMNEFARPMRYVRSRSVGKRTRLIRTSFGCNGTYRPSRSGKPTPGS